jgi:hypothetical protein
MKLTAGRNFSMLMAGPHRQTHDHHMARYLNAPQGARFTLRFPAAEAVPGGLIVLVAERARYNADALAEHFITNRDRLGFE